MKKIFNAKIKKISLSILTLIGFILQFCMLFTPLKNFDGSVMSKASFIIEADNFAPLIALFFVIFTIINFGFVIAGMFLILKGKNKHSLYLVPNIIINTLMIILNNVFKVITIGGNVLISISLVFSLLSVLYLGCEKIINKDKTSVIQDENVTKHRALIVIAFLSFIGIFATIFMPFASIQINDSVLTLNPIYALFSSSSIFENLVIFVLCFIAIIISFIKFLTLFDKTETVGIYYKRVRNYIVLNYSFSLIYLLGGLIYTFAINMLGYKCNTISYIPCSFISIVAIVFAVLYGHEVEKQSKIKNRTKTKSSLGCRIEIDVFIILFTVVTALTLLLDIFYVKYSISNVYESFETVSGSLRINGLEIIMHYATLSRKMQYVALLLFTLLTISSVMFVSSIIASISKSKSFYKIALFTIVANLIFTFLIGLFGKYFEIAQQIDVEIIKNYIESVDADINLNDYSEIKVTSQSFYMFIVDALLLFILLCRSPLTRLERMNASSDIVFDSLNSQDGIVNNFEFNDTRIEAIDNRETEEEVKVEEKEEEEEVVKVIPDFDACPAFSELDQKYELYKKDLEMRKSVSFDAISLPELVRFIVNYARDSRLHLFYSYEDMAAFIAGLGSSRLSILQGMSGTGKTSLPKIFLEAIMGNCEIVEVESSWRDKNELLGYYNEFSKNYTPKKFTQALYKAKLNEEIMTFIVLDEMNLSRIEYYFSDFLSLMEDEEDKRKIKLLNVKIHNDYDNEVHSYLALSEDHTLMIPHNVFFIGTANKDESTFEISDKVYDRAMTMNFNTRAKSQEIFNEASSPKFLSYTRFNELINAAKEAYKFTLDDNKIVKEVENILLPYNISFGNRIARQIESFVKVYCSCFDNPKAKESEALETILLSKVVAKLENKNVDNKEDLVAAFERLKLFRCAKFAAKLNED